MSENASPAATGVFLRASAQLPQHHHIRLRLASTLLQLDVHLPLRSAWTVLFGPSGSGKSTLLRAVAGIAPGVQAHVVRGEGAAGVVLDALPPEARAVAYAPQRSLLFPHLSVRDNLLLPQRAKSGSRAGEADELARVATLCRVDNLLARRPAALSGGESSRVALARALMVPDARLLLLDEPFSALDRGLRQELLPAVRAYCAERALPVLSVTHDIEEAFLLEADVAVLKGGHIVRQGPPAEVLAAERDALLRHVRG